MDYSYRDSKNFRFHRKTRMRAELLSTAAERKIINDKRAKEKAKK